MASLKTVVANAPKLHCAKLSEETGQNFAMKFCTLTLTLIVVVRKEKNSEKPHPQKLRVVSSKKCAR
jgi:hypothetical protein